MNQISKQKYTLNIATADQGQRLDVYLAGRYPQFSRSYIQNLIKGGAVLVNGKKVKTGYSLLNGDTVTMEIADAVSMKAEPENIELNIIYEDSDIIVINKPQGMVVHPAAGHMEGTLVNALLHHCGDLSGINGVIRPGIVHRIDRDTSGLLLVAKTDQAHLSLSEQIKAHSCDRVYQAVVYGRMKEPEGRVDAPIGRNPLERKEMCVTAKNSKEAVTNYRVLQEYEGFSHLELRLETGRTHQIRVHMAYLGHPVAGDPVYGPKKVIKSLEGQCLHAKSIAFDHPVTGERMRFDSELPAYFTDFLRTLRPL